MFTKKILDEIGVGFGQFLKFLIFWMMMTWLLPIYVLRNFWPAVRSLVKKIYKKSGQFDLKFLI